MNARKVSRYKSLEVPRQAGEVGRVRVLKGPDAGITFILRDSSVVMGRGDEADLVLTDPKTSRTHAKLEYTPQGWKVSDLGSANGIFYQGEYLRMFEIQSSEHFTVGETILEFLSHSESTRVLALPPKPAQDIVDHDRALAAQRLRVKNIAKGPRVLSRTGEKKENPKKIILYIAVLAAMYFWDDIEGLKEAPKVAPKKSSTAAQRQDRGLASYLPPGVGKDAVKSAEQSYWQGFREYRQGNFLRAQEHFQLALQVNPAHELAHFYLKSAEKEIENHINRMMSAAQKAMAAGRLREAKGYYETAMRSMFSDRSNPDYVECEAAVKKINEMMGRVPSSEVKP